MKLLFLDDESGAVTVDWTVLTAAIVGLGISAAAAVRTGTTSLGQDVESSLSGASVADLSWAFTSRLVSQNFADGNTTGWSRGITMAMGEWGPLLGPFANDTQNNPLTYGVSLSPGKSNALIEFDLVVADTWDGAAGPDNPWTRPDGDVIRFQVNGQTISAEPFVMRENHPGYRPGMFDTRQTSVEIDGATYNLTLTPKDILTSNQGGIGYADQRWRVQLEATGAPQNFEIGYSATTSQGTHNEFFGITDFTVTEN